MNFHVTWHLAEYFSLYQFHQASGQKVALARTFNSSKTLDVQNRVQRDFHQRLTLKSFRFQQCVVEWTFSRLYYGPTFQNVSKQ